MLRSRVGLTGFSMKSKAPLFIAVTAASTLPCAVSRMTATCWGAAAMLLQQFHAIHAGHFQVGDHDRRSPGFDLGQALDAVLGGIGLVAPGTDQFGQARFARSPRPRRSVLFPRIMRNKLPLGKRRSATRIAFPRLTRLLDSAH